RSAYAPSAPCGRNMRNTPTTPWRIGPSSASRSARPPAGAICAPDPIGAEAAGQWPKRPASGRSVAVSGRSVAVNDRVAAGERVQHPLRRGGDLVDGRLEDLRVRPRRDAVPAHLADEL